MRLTDDANDLYLPPATNADLCVDRADAVAPPAVADLVAALLPARIAALAPAPLRDALAAAWGAIANLAQARIGQHLARVQSPRSADGAWLDDVWGVLFKLGRAPGESDADYRARLLAQFDVVSPAALDAAIAAVVARFTPVAPVVLEPAVDALFAAPNDTGPWVGWAQPPTARLWADYLPTDGAHAGAYAVPVVTGALFWVVLPGAAGDGEPAPYAEPDAWPTDTPYDAPADYLGADDAHAGAYAYGPDGVLLEALATEVEARRAGGVPWLGMTDQNLFNAR